jgi:rubrerythrin
MLQFTHGVEIGAHQAYLGHFARTNDLKVKEIADDEMLHQKQIRCILAKHGATTKLIFDVPFLLVGKTVSLFCKISPLFMLNLVANMLEKFAVFSYDVLANRFPEDRVALLEMAAKELEHEEYFKL